MYKCSLRLGLRQVWRGGGRDSVFDTIIITIVTDMHLREWGAAHVMWAPPTTGSSLAPGTYVGTMCAALGNVVIIHVYSILLCAWHRCRRDHRSIYRSSSSLASLEAHSHQHGSCRLHWNSPLGQEARRFLHSADDYLYATWPTWPVTRTLPAWAVFH